MHVCASVPAEPNLSSRSHTWAAAVLYVQPQGPCRGHCQSAWLHFSTHFTLFIARWSAAVTAARHIVVTWSTCAVCVLQRTSTTALSYFQWSISLFLAQPLRWLPETLGEQRLEARAEKMCLACVRRCPAFEQLHCRAAAHRGWMSARQFLSVKPCHRNWK